MTDGKASNHRRQNGSDPYIWNHFLRNKCDQILTYPYPYTDPYKWNLSCQFGMPVAACVNAQ